MTLIRSSNGRVVEARANWGRWIADCPFCPSAMWVNPDMLAFTCEECHTTAEILWPAEETICSIERILLMRPDVSTRNWNPGESLHDLMFENGAHNVLNMTERGMVSEPGTTLFHLDDKGIRVDNLPISGPPELKAVEA